MTSAAPVTNGQHLTALHRPSWLKDIEATHSARAAHFFLLHSNIGDYVFDGVNPPRRLIPYLANDLRDRGFRRLALVNLSTGIGWSDGEKTVTSTKPAEPAAILAALVETLHAGTDAATGVLLENLENLVPASGVNDRETLRAAEILTGLAQDEKLRASGCLIIATCRAPELLTPGLIEAPGGVHVINVPLPRAEDRLRFLDYLGSSAAVTLAPLEEGLSRSTLSNLTQGVTLASLDVLNRQACAAGKPITYARIRECKKAAIERQSRGLIEELDPRYGFEAVGGLSHVISYLRTAVGHLREGRPNQAPKGVLLAGPPGTGKTLVAEALAKEAGFNLVRLGDVRSMWVGESERNLSQVLRLLVELAPVVVFVDEVDQMVGGRDNGWNGDSGVSARLFARILNFMGRNEHRGRVIWVAATNRPDLLDEAMLRRFDRVFPFFVPGPKDRRRILDAMPAITGATFAADVTLDGVIDATSGLTGSAIELIVRRAMELSGSNPLDDTILLQAANDYKPNHDAREYARQNVLAFHAANLYSSLPPSDELPNEIVELIAAQPCRGQERGIGECRRSFIPADAATQVAG